MLENKRYFFDGGMGTMLQKSGLSAGAVPEELNITAPELIRSVHRAYREAGADIITTNTFGANPLKLESRYSLGEIIRAAVLNARSAGEGLVALDVGPTGALLRPIGDMDFETAYRAFYETVKLGADAGADMIIIETMSDILEAKAAVLAAKEACRLPVLVTMTFDENGKALTGADPECMAAVMEGLGADAIGINCGLGPKQILPLAKRLAAVASVPLVVQPNAGLPSVVNGETVYDVSPEDFASCAAEIARLGVGFIGGCCGTTPEHIALTVERCADIPYAPPEDKGLRVCASYSHALRIGGRPLIIGERINPTGKKKFKEALRLGDHEYILGEAAAQSAAGADALDVNVGSPDIDERAVMEAIVPKIQAVSDLPLQIDSSSPEVLEAAMRLYSGKPLVNSVNGKEDTMRAVFPLVKKYGGVVVGLTLDENGIPDTPEGRLAIAERIVAVAAEYGIKPKDIIIDALTMTVATDDMAAVKTAEALRLIKQRLGVATVLGVSNISFGLPNRPSVNAAFLDMAVKAGLDCAIYNPLAPKSEYGPEAVAVVEGRDFGCARYIEAATAAEAAPASASAAEKLSLEKLIETGQKERAYAAAKELLKTVSPMELINGRIIPALNAVGEGFEKGRLFLPQLMSGADSAKRAFDAVKETSAGGAEDRGTIVLATVKGDIHDIGKNIAALLLGNYGYNVVDLGRDVAPEAVVAAVRETGARLLGLSALMTTTVTSMEQTVKAVRESGLDCRIMVGGAVLTESYAKEIGADFYVKDALADVDVAKSVYGGEQN